MRGLAATSRAAMVVLSACGSPGAPSGPGDRLLSIQPLIGTIAVGVPQTFHATYHDQSGDHDVNASWTVSDVTTATVDGHGTVTGVRDGSVTLIATYLDRSSTRTLQVRQPYTGPIYAGAWRGDIKLVHCARVSGAGPSACDYITGTSWRFNLSLTQDYEIVKGLPQIVIQDMTSSGSLTGQVETSGHLLLSGSFTASGGPGELVEWDVSSWDLATDGMRGLSGTLRAIERQTNYWGPQVVDMEYQTQFSPGP